MIVIIIIIHFHFVEPPNFRCIGDVWETEMETNETPVISQIKTTRYEPGSLNKLHSLQMKLKIK